MPMVVIFYHKGHEDHKEIRSPFVTAQFAKELGLGTHQS
jgi:hypothetical protein